MKLASTMTFLTTVVLAGCETSNTNTQGNAGFNDLRQEVINACTKRADNLWGAAPGTSVANEGQPDRDGNWQLRVSTGNYRSTCTVTPSGYVVGIYLGRESSGEGKAGGRVRPSIQPCGHIKTGQGQSNRRALLRHRRALSH